jgi:transcriptional/translational regulatory protein YebC/TACO1
MTVPLSDADTEVLASLIEALEDCDEVQEVITIAE